eukprot:scaffold98082_cov37-Tisochrysis_lutea.AAC.1
MPAPTTATSYSPRRSASAETRSGVPARAGGGDARLRNPCAACCPTLAHAPSSSRERASSTRPLLVAAIGSAFHSPTLSELS